MAQKVQVLLLDDIDGSTATETISFALEGVAYEIDLSTSNATKLRTALTKYVEHARKIRSAAPTRRRRGGSSAAPDNADVRAWARNNGRKVNERGRIPAVIVAEYQAAHAS